MAVLEEQERSALQLLDPRRPAKLQERLGRWPREDERIVGDDLPIEALHPGHGCKERRIEPPFAQRAQDSGGLLLAPADGQPRVAGAEGRPQ
jgi:hypothetical protein